MKNKGEANQEKKQIMRQWKKSYLEALVETLKPKGDVLQVGFGLGYASDKIQTFKPKSLTIVEQDPEMFKAAKSWAQKHSNVSVVEGKWQNVLTGLGVFDSILLNEYPIDSEMGMMTRVHSDEIVKTSEQAKELLSKMESQLAQMDVHYSDEEIDQFFQKTGQHNQKELPVFFKQLKERGFITDKQYKHAMQKYHLENGGQQIESNLAQDTTYVFLDECLKNHMRKGSRFTYFSNDVISKYEDSQFFENVVTNPFVDFHEEVISIKVPSFSEYFKFDEALIVVVEKF